MPRDGSGVHSLPAGYLAVTGEPVLPSDHNPPLEDLSASITESIARTGVTTITADIPFSGKRITSLGDAVNPADAVNKQTAESLIASNPSKGHIFGLTLLNNVTDATNDIDIAAGECASDAASPSTIALANALIKRLDGSWSVGTNQGGLDTGSIANTTYHVWVIRRPDTGVVDALFSASATAPTMPANYTQKRRIGSFLRVSGAIVAFTQQGDIFLKSAPTADIAVTNLGTAATLYTLAVPIGVKVEALISGYIFRTSTSAALLTSPDQADTAPNTAGPATVANDANVSGSFQTGIITNTSGQIRARSTAASTSIWITTNGWVDRRGRF